MIEKKMKTKTNASFDWLRMTRSNFIFGTTGILVCIITYSITEEYQTPNSIENIAAHSSIWFFVGVLSFVVPPSRMANFILLLDIFACAAIYPRYYHDPKIVSLFAISSALYGAIIGAHIKWLILNRRKK